MGKENLTPLTVLQELIHSYFLSSAYIIMLRFQKSMIMECSLFTIRLKRTMYPLKLAHLAKKKPNHLLVGKMGW